MCHSNVGMCVWWSLWLYANHCRLTYMFVCKLCACLCKVIYVHISCAAALIEKVNSKSHHLDPMLSWHRKKKSKMNTGKKPKPNKTKTHSKTKNQTIPERSHSIKKAEGNKIWTCCSWRDTVETCVFWLLKVRPQQRDVSLWLKSHYYFSSQKTQLIG